CRVRPPSRDDRLARLARQVAVDRGRRLHDDMDLRRGAVDERRQDLRAREAVGCAIERPHARRARVVRWPWRERNVEGEVAGVDVGDGMAERMTLDAEQAE